MMPSPGSPKTTPGTTQNQPSATPKVMARQAKLVGRPEELSWRTLLYLLFSAIIVTGPIAAIYTKLQALSVSAAFAPSRVVSRAPTPTDFFTLEPGKEVWVQTPSSFSWTLHEGEGFYVQFYDKQMRPVKFRLGGKVVGPRPVLINRINNQTPFTFSGDHLRIIGPKEGTSTVEIRLGG